MKRWRTSGQRLQEEVGKERAELQEILSPGTDDGERLAKLKDLAVRVGASTINMYKGHGEASQPELVHNLHQALQTKSMVAAVKTSGEYLTVSIVLAFIAVGSMAAAWLAVWLR